jgi:hypothetical protein
MSWLSALSASFTRSASGLTLARPAASNLQFALAPGQRIDGRDRLFGESFGPQISR